MAINVEANAEHYLRLYADCIPVKGAIRSSICDLTRNELIFFPSEYYEVLQYLTSDKIGRLLDVLESEEEKQAVIEFIEFLNQHELITFLKDPSLFPPIQERWEVPAIIQNAIIDVDTLSHDFDKIFYELDELGCQFVQIRSFSTLLAIQDLYSILSLAGHKSIQSIDLIIKYNAVIPDEAYSKLVEEYPILSGLTIHSSPENRSVKVDYGCDESARRYIEKEILFISQGIDSHLHCGLITLKSLNAPTVGNFFETKLYNGCLNRKVSIDAFGEIKNCPSMPKSYGNIRDISLEVAILSTGFQEKWKITKDQIDTCKDCEFRYVCSDCRAYVEHPADMYSKPLKCGYNPYTCEWEEWSLNPLKQQAIEYYGIQTLVVKENGISIATHSFD
jgi:SPASM domain peptide maturase of grasp-with-spasm system